jgi:hypothetical protein
LFALGIPVTAIQKRPPGYFIDISLIFNHARRLRLKKLLYLELSRISNGFFKPLRGSSGGFTFETAAAAVSEVKRPIRNRFGSETVKTL